MLLEMSIELYQATIRTLLSLGAANLFTLTISIVSLAVSLRAMQVTKDTHSDEITSSLINQNYDDFIDLHELRAQFPYHGHLFELKDQYDQVKNEVVAALVSLSEDDRLKLLPRLKLEERALARRIFSQYENAFYQWQNTSRSRDKSRLWFHKDVADYFSQRLLRNPRLVWFWRSSGGNYRLHYEPLTRDHYDRTVVETSVDDTGPFQEAALRSHKIHAVA